MGKILTGGIVAAISGKVGDVVYSRNSYGAYVRTLGGWTHPTNPNWGDNQESYANLNSSWHVITEDQRTAWRKFASTLRNVYNFGYQAAPGAVQLFVKRSAIRWKYDGSYFAAPPPTDQPAYVTSCRFTTLTEFSVQLEVNFNKVPGNSFLCIEMIEGLGIPRKYIKNLLRLISISIVPDPVTSYTIELIGDYTSYFGHGIDLGYNAFVARAYICSDISGIRTYHQEARAIKS